MFLFIIDLFPQRDLINLLKLGNFYNRCLRGIEGRDYYCFYSSDKQLLNNYFVYDSELNVSLTVLSL